MKIAVLDDYQEVARTFASWERLGDRADVTFFHDHVSDEDALAERLAPFAGIVAMRERTPFPRTLLERLPALRLLVTTGMGNAAIDVAAARSLGVTVCGTGMWGPGTAELTWGLILGLLRHIPAEDRLLREGGWQATVGGDLSERRLGLLGLGRLGRQVARVGLAFGMDVVAWSQNLRAEDAAAVGVRAVEREEVLRTSDVVSIHLRLSGRTRGLVGAAELALMRPGALLVNTSRGPIVDTAALVDALRSGRLGGAALDVYDVEPLPAGHPLRDAPRTLLTPHIGYVTSASYERCYADALQDIEAFLDGEPVRVLDG